MKKDIHFLYEVGSMRFIDRTWKQFMRMTMANNAEHSFRVAWLALLMAHQEGADEGKVLKMALMHDLSETRTGDTNYVSRMYTTRDDESAYADIFSGTSVAQDMLALAYEYKERVSLESSIVKDADNLEVDFEIQESIAAGNTLGEQWIAGRRAGVRPKLFTDTARKLFDQIYESNPAAWHLTAKNRITAGDFKPDA